MPLFPDTRLSVIQALNSDDDAARAQATELAARAYRGPIIAVLRARFALDTDDAEDLAHDFFEQALAKRWLARYDPARGRFRTFLRSCLAAYASTAHESATRLKRGGGAAHVSLDDAPPLESGDEASDALFDREWARSVLAMALDALREECERERRAATFDVFRAREIDGADADAPPSYADLAARFDLPVMQVTNYLSWARRRFRAHVLDTLRSLTSTDDEFRAEARALLGVDLSGETR